ncbi:solute carrier organic anion transporter family member 1B3 [Bos mutus]|uniref:solute carrier organic anion transporter family member 1B3 n=1 Tax=Bos mutus TaxID=72004 RepID=UPI0038B5C7B6
MMDQNHHSDKTAETQPSEKKTTRNCCNGFKMFLAALSLSFISKALGAVIMKSSITQIERRFDISSSTVGLIDGSFEIGNLLVIVFVSYFGAKLHRPKLIGIGCIIMGTGSILTALPHFFMGYYRYSKDTTFNPSENSTSNLPTCSINQNLLPNRTSLEVVGKGLEKDSGSYMWIYVLMGNMLRGIGETPIGPLGISYIDDFAEEGHSSLYLGNLLAVTMIGPIIGFILVSQFSKMYVDIGYVDLSTIRITPKDSRWVGAWWLGFLAAGLIAIISSIPFFFLPKTLNKPNKEKKASASSVSLPMKNEEKSQMASLTKTGQNVTDTVTGFLQSLKSILTNPLYVLTLFLTLLQASSHIGSITYVFKYVEQQYGNSASETSILLGFISIPSLAAGMFTGGFIVKKFKFTLVGIAKFSLCAHMTSFLFHLINFALICENKSVAGLTLTYDGNTPVASHVNVPLSYCNSDCNCDPTQWEPLCGSNGITYMSPCLAGCTSSSGSKKSIVFHNCSCVEENGFQSKNNSMKLGECPKSDDCKRKFYIYIIVQILTLFSAALGSTSNIMLIFKNVEPELKSLAMGFHSLTIRTLGGIPAPIYFGALIDRACMKWSINNYGKQGSCRLYNSLLYGHTFFGLTTGLKFPALVLFVVLIFAMKKKYQGKDIKASENETKAVNEANSGPLINDAKVDHETHI